MYNFTSIQLNPRVSRKGPVPESPFAQSLGTPFGGNWVPSRPLGFQKLFETPTVRWRLNALLKRLLLQLLWARKAELTLIGGRNPRICTKEDPQNTTESPIEAILVRGIKHHQKHRCKTNPSILLAFSLTGDHKALQAGLLRSISENWVSSWLPRKAFATLGNSNPWNVSIIDDNRPVFGFQFFGGCRSLWPWRTSYCAPPALIQFISIQLLVGPPKGDLVVEEGLHEGIIIQLLK